MLTTRPRKLRHIDTHTLWVQEKVRSKAMKLRKVRGDLNPADLLTKHIPSQEKLNQLVTLFGCAFVDGRAKSAPLLRKTRLDEMAGKGVVDNDIIEAERIDEDGNVYMLEAGPQVVERWPRLYHADVLEVMLPIVVAAPEVEDVSVEALGKHRAVE